jgi:hypothetical protein
MEDVPADILKDYQYRVREKLRDLDENSFPRLENYILSGGVDLTADVVREVLKQYDYSIKRYQAVEETVKEYRLQRRAK